ncbi:MAG: M3 family metallopeptidase [Clostridia bacterium]
MADKITKENDLKLYLDEIESKLEENSNKISKLSYQRYIDKEQKPEISELQKENSKILLDQTLHSTIKKWKGKIDDPLLSRRVEVWDEKITLSKVDSNPKIIELQQEVAYKVMSHKYKIDDKEYSLGEIRAITRADKNKNNRRKAWESHTELNNLVKKDMLRLFRLRNNVARKMGFDSYVDLKLEINNQMRKSEVINLLTTLTKSTDQFYEELLTNGAKKLGIEKIEPWDIQYILEQLGGVDKSYFPKTKLNESLSQWANHMDFKLEDYGIEPVFYDIPYNGLTMSLDRETIKILCNPDDGYTYYRTHFHELGHALHSALKEVDSYILRRESSIFTEGIAEIFGYITNDFKWLTDFYGLDEKVALNTLKSAIGPKYHYIRQRTAYCLFEYQAYSDLDQNMDKLMAEVESDILKCSYDETPRWASNGWYVSYPVYWQNYVLADFVASQIHHHLEKNIGSLVSDKKAYDYVIDNYISQGALIPWLEKIKEGTGEPLNSKAIIADLSVTY